MGSFPPGRMNIKNIFSCHCFRKSYQNTSTDVTGPVTQSQFSTVGSMLEISQVPAFTSYMRWHPTSMSSKKPWKVWTFTLWQSRKNASLQGFFHVLCVFSFFIGGGLGVWRVKKSRKQIYPHLSPLTLHFILLLAKWETTSVRAKRGCTGVTALQSPNSSKVTIYLQCLILPTGGNSMIQWSLL